MNSNPFSDNYNESTLLSLLTHPHSIIDTSFSTKNEEDDTLYLNHLLKDEFKFIEPPEELLYKNEILLKLKYIIRKWVCSIHESILGEEEKKNRYFKGDLLTFGSYMLQCYTKDSDIDTVCIVPNFIKRNEHFFGVLYDILSQNEKVKSLMVIKETNVPLIKMKFYDVQIDILFAQINVLALDQKLEEIIYSEQIFTFFDDEKSFTSINGIRTCYSILNSVPNINCFQTTLKYVKLWAKNKGIYSNLMGYLGGISWAILVAKICQLYPNYKPSKLLERFFMIYYKWPWDELDVKIEEMNEEKKAQTSRKSSFMKDNWQENTDKDTMNILTPCFPCKNSSYTVTNNTLGVIKCHMNEAVIILSKIKQGIFDWRHLFEKYNFFNNYMKFIKINIYEIKIQEIEARNLEKNNEDFIKWRGIVESKLRRMSKILETNIISNILDICLYPIGFETNDINHKNSIIYYYGLKIKKSFVLQSAENKKFINFMPLILWFIENLQRNERIPPQMNLDTTLVKYTKIDKKHIRELENKFLVSGFENKIAKHQIKNDKSKMYLDNDFLKKSYYSDKMMNDYDNLTTQSSIFTLNKKLKYIF